MSRRPNRAASIDRALARQWAGAIDTPTVETRVGELIDPQPDGCWLWRGGLGTGGYGSHATAGTVHRFVYETLVGPIPDGHVLHHRCHVRACVNPEHLEPLTLSEHTAHHNRQRRAS